MELLTFTRNQQTRRKQELGKLADSFSVWFKPLNSRYTKTFFFVCEIDLIASMINWQELSVVKGWLTME